MCLNNVLSPGELAALVIAPPLAPVFLVMIITFPHYGGSDFFSTMQLITLFGAPIAYLLALCIGLPLYWWAKDHCWVNFWSLSLGGAFIAALPTLITLLFLYDTWEAGREWKLHAVLGITGFFVGAVFWAILRYWPHNLTFERDALKRAP